MKLLALCLLLFVSANLLGQTKSDSNIVYSNKSYLMDTITFRQINGTNIFLVTNRDGDINYIETLDGYTLVLSTLGLYEYAKKGKGGDLVPSGLTAHNDFQRTDKEVKKLKKIPLHLRFGGDILKEKEKRANKYKNLNPKYEYRYEK